MYATISKPRGGAWNVGDQKQPDGYAVLILDAASAPRGYWLAYAYTTAEDANSVAEKCKGIVVPFIFQNAGKGQLIEGGWKLKAEDCYEAYDLLRQGLEGADPREWNHRVRALLTRRT